MQTKYFDFKKIRRLERTRQGNSSVLTLAGRVARDLASAYENWLANSSMLEAALTQVSARTLANIRKVESSLRLKIEKYLNQEVKYTESDLSDFS